MARSQNGWSANDRSVINTKTVPGTNVRLPVRKGAAGDLLIEVALAWHRLVEPLVIPGCWGYAERAIRGSSTTLSNHASGTAIDCNAPKHPLAVRGTFTAAQRSQLQKIAAVTGNVIRFGEFYVGRVDGMHAEVNDGRTEADCARALAALRQFNGSGGTTVTPATGGPVTAPSPKDTTVIDNIPLARGRNDFRVIVPVGSASQLIAQAWVSIVGNGAPVSGTVYVQSDRAGIENWLVGTTFKDGLSSRFNREIPSGTTQLGIVVNAPAGGSLAIEARPK